MGSSDLFDYLEKCNVTLDRYYDDKLDNYPKKPWTKFINKENKLLVNDDALDLLDKMLIYDHSERITPKDAMEHPYFKPIKENQE